MVEKQRPIERTNARGAAQRGEGRGQGPWQRKIGALATSRFKAHRPHLVVPVLRQSFWDRERRHLREALARLVDDARRLADDAASDGGWSAGLARDF